MESGVPSSIDIPLGDVTGYDKEAPLAFRRERYWFLSFMMAPFKDIDMRAVADTEPPRRPKRGRR